MNQSNQTSAAAIAAIAQGFAVASALDTALIVQAATGRTTLSKSINLSDVDSF